MNLVKLQIELANRGVLDLCTEVIQGDSSLCLIYAKQRHRALYVNINRSSEKCFNVAYGSKRKGFRNYKTASAEVENIIKNYIAKMQYIKENINFHVSDKQYKWHDFSKDKILQDNNG